MQIIGNDNNGMVNEFLFVYKYFQKRYFKSRQLGLLGIYNYTDKQVFLTF